MALTAAFTPTGTTESISVTTSSGTATLTEANSSQLLLTNEGSTICYWTWGNGSATATAADTPILGESALIVSKPSQYDTIAAITSSGTTTLKITPGQGI